MLILVLLLAIPAHLDLELHTSFNSHWDFLTGFVAREVYVLPCMVCIFRTSTVNVFFLTC